MGTLDVYMPMDRRQALSRGESLPSRTYGAALFADISGFTPLTAALVEELGPQRGAEELTHQLHRVYDALIAELHRYGGSVIGFSGDAITCWLDDAPVELAVPAGQAGLRGVACALAMQGAMRQFAEVRTPRGTTISLGVKVTVVAGEARRFLVGDRAIMRLEALTGRTLERMAAAEKQAERGEVVVGAEVVSRSGKQVAVPVTVQAWRKSPIGERFAVVDGLRDPVEDAPWPEMPSIDEGIAREWIFPPVYQRLSEQGDFLAELRPATALFIKFWGLNYDQDEEAGAKLDAYIAWVQRTAMSCEGYLVDLTVGDKGSYIYVAFGAPIAHEDDPARAVTTALALRQMPPELDFIEGVQMGISRGRMRAGPCGGDARRTYAVMGNEVNIAARLMGKAKPGQILVSPRVAEAAHRHAFEPLGAVELKGVAEPMEVFAALDAPTEAGETTLKGRALTPMVGRTVERAMLGQRLQVLVEERVCGVIVIEGEAGIGKSRLALDLMARAGDAGIETLLGVGQSIEQQTPYRAWRDVFVAYFGLGGTADPAERRWRVQDLVQATAPDHVQRLPLLNDALNLGFPENDLTALLTPELRQQNLFLLLAGLLRARGAEHPLLVVLEDVHWLDSLSWELAVYLARAIAIAKATPLLLALVTRPPEENTAAARHTAALKGMEITHALTLTSLGPEETVALVEGRMGIPEGSLPDAVAGLLHERCGGNPFFAEELILTLHEQGMIHVDMADGQMRCSISDAFDEAARTLPDNVQGLILSRIDRLSQEQQLTLKVASVIGRTFPYASLNHTLKHHTAITDVALQRHLDDLAALDLTPLDTPEPDLAYIFRHATIHEVAYQTLLFAQRRELHHTVAGWYEATYGETEEQLASYFPLLVHHYHHAEDAGQERRYAGLAGNRAAAQYANAEAVRYLSRALELTPEAETVERYDLLMAREKVYNLQGERESQTQDIAAIQELADTLDDDRRRAEAALRQVYYAEATGDYPAATATVEEAIRLAQAVRDAQAEATGYLRWGVVLFLQGKPDEAQRRLERALVRAREGGQAQVEADSLLNLGNIFCFNRGDYPQARAHWEQALEAYRAAGDRLGENKPLNNLGLVCWYQGDLDKAKSYYEQALHICRETGDRRGEARALCNSGAIADLQGHFSEAQARFEQALFICREAKDPLVESRAIMSLGTLARRQGQYDVAQAYLAQSLRNCQELSDRRVECHALSNMSLLARLQGDYGSALNRSRQALAIARDLGDRSIENGALLHQGHALAELGQQDEAVDAYREGLAIARELEEYNVVIESLAGLARVSMVRGDLAQALAWVDELLNCLAERSLDGTYEPFRVYLTCYQVLEAARDARAGDILVTTYRLLQQQAGGIEDEDLQRSFLQNVVAHRMIGQAYEDWLGGQENGEKS